MNPARRTPHHLSLAILTAVLALITAACGSSNPLGGELSTRSEVFRRLWSATMCAPTARAPNGSATPWSAS